MESGTDWISKLPDSVLCHILSFLPTKYAVGTSVLSKRWQYLWTSVTTIDFDDYLLLGEGYGTIDDREDEHQLYFGNFVNRVLLLSDASRLKKFRLQLALFFNFDLVDTWISAAIKRSVQNLVLHYNLDSEYYTENPVPVPCSVFNSKTLVNLSLEGDILLKIPASVWLPSLKKITLNDIKYENDDSAQKLFDGCPVLEELSIYRWLSDIRKVLIISVPTLKLLKVNRIGDDYYDPFDDSYRRDESNDKHYKLVVNAPKLEHLNLTDYEVMDFLFENLSSLVKAHVTIQPSFSRNDDGHIPALLRGMANVKFLDFSTGHNDYLLPTFCNLTRLRLGTDDDDDGWSLDMLMEFLEYSPNLEVLILEGPRVIGSSKAWSPPPQVPPCLLLHLKEIEIQKFDGKEYELEVIEYLLKNAKVLKKMTIDCKTSGCCFCEQFAGYPRGSKTCQLNLLL